MKTKLFVERFVGFAVVLGAGLVLFASPAARGASAIELLEKAIYTEETKGEIKTAADIYQQILDDPRADRTVAAQANLRLGLCQLKLGNKPQAIAALDRLTRDFLDKDKFLAIVDQHMPQVLDDIVQQIERNYIQEVDRGELVETALRAIVGKLDSRGSLLRTNDMEFLGTNELTELNVQIEQKITGIGAVLSATNGGVFVRSLLPGSPALQTGLRAGDRISTVDGKELPPNQLATAVKLLRGPVGTSVTLGIKRAESEELQEIQVVRDTIRISSVSGDRRKPDNTWEFMLDERAKIGYIRLSEVGKQSADEIRLALEDLKARGLKGLLLDLRDNPGGVLDGAVAISDLFVEAGRILTVKGRSGETVYDAKVEGTFTGFPVVVLVNRNTASAAEIIAACLQDHQRAIVVGERTFGQGIVRSLFPLKSGIGALKLPIAAYYRPSGKSVNRYPDSQDSDDWGITPDAGYEVTLTDDEIKQQRDRAARDSSQMETHSKMPDRQFQKALECLLAQLARQQ